MSGASNKSRRGERRAVNTSQTFFEENDLVFQEVDLRNDVGKDAILDLARSGADAGLAIALQIKGGRKYKRRSGHSIPIDPRLRKVWRDSSIPVFVIILDPDDGELYWGDLAKMAQMASADARTIPVSPNARLTPDGLSQFLQAARLACSGRRGARLLDLTSDDPDILNSALFDCLALGRYDPRYFHLVKSSFLGIRDQGSFCAAVHMLSHATPHPDIPWREETYVPEEAAREIRKSFRWTPNEIAMALARLPEEEGCWGRGTVGQSLYMILESDPSLEWAVDRLLVESFRVDGPTWRSSWVKGPPFGPTWVRTDRDAVTLPCLTLALYLAEDPRGRLNELEERLPPIKGIPMFWDIADTVTGFGSIDIF
jgi:hypothetical protein